MKILDQNVLIIWSFFLMIDMICGDTIEPDESSLIAKREKSGSSCRGLPGLPGRNGRDGRDAGLRGRPGKPGAAGPAGRPGPKGADGESTGGVVYTRWGRKHCPQTSGTTELYSGVMGGPYHTHGGGSNYLCLPLNPIFDKITPGVQGYSYMYGTEYETNAHNTKIFPKNLHDHDAPCAVCDTESRGKHLMIPARNVCPTGWTLEYKGYLMSAHVSHKRSQFICVDENAEATTGSHPNHNGALLYVVESQCGSLPCPPYGNGKELTCVVCTK